MENIQSFLIDDEPKALENLIFLLDNYCPFIKVLGSASSVSTSIAFLSNNKIDVLFLDVELRDGTGFDILNTLPSIDFEIIFISGFDHYAINAIKFSAIDYLLKPINTKELLVALDKVNTKIKNKQTKDISILMDMIKEPNRPSNRIIVPSSEGLEVVPVNQILYCEASNEYTYIHLQNQTKILSSFNIGEYESILFQYAFFRNHHSYLINKNFIQKYIKGDGGSIILTSGIQLPVSRRKKMDFLDWLKKA